MPVGETIADYLRGERENKRNVRNDRWAKLMEAAGFGADIWQTISGRKYQTGEREAAQGADTNARLATQAFGSSEAAKARAAEAEQGLYGKAFTAKENALDRAARLAEAKAGKNPNEGELNRRLNEALASVTTLNPDFVIPDPNNPNNSILDLNKAKDIKDAVLAFFEDPAERAWAARQLDLTIARWTPKETTTTVDQNGTAISPNLEAYKNEQLAKYDPVAGIAKAKKLLESVKTINILGKKVVSDPTGIGQKIETELAFIANKLADDPEAQAIVSTLAQKGTPPVQQLQQILAKLERIWKAKTSPTPATRIPPLSSIR